MTSWSWMVVARSEYEHWTASGLQGPRVNLPYRLGRTTHCVLSTSGRGGSVFSQRVRKVWSSQVPVGSGERKTNGPLRTLFFKSIVMGFSASILLGGALPLSGSCPLGWGTALATVTTSPISQEKVFLFLLCVLFFGEKNLLFFEG